MKSKITRIGTITVIEKGKTVILKGQHDALRVFGDMTKRLLHV